MTHLEQVRQSINELKNCPTEDISKYFSRIVTFFKYLPKEDKNDCAHAFYKWAAENSGCGLQKLSYSEFLLGMYHFTVEEFEPALGLFTKARKQFDDLEDHDGKANCALLIAATYRTLGNFDLALKISFEAYAHLKQSANYPSSLAACANNMANINLELHHYDEARSMFLVAYEESQKVHDSYFTIYALHGLGKVSMEQNDAAAAKEFFEKALQLAKENHTLLGISNSISELANLSARGNDLAAAEQLNKEALAMREENHFTAGAITNCIKLGEIYIKQSRWKEALDILNKGLAMAEQIKVKPKIYQAHFLLSKIYKSKNDLEKSLHHYEIFHEIREQVLEEDNARKLADAKLIFEAEQTKKENVIIKKQKHEIEKKNAELQDTIDELTLARVSRKAKALTLGVAIAMFIFEDPIIGFSLRLLSSHNYWLSLFLKMAIIFSLSPINRAIENYLLKKVIRRKKQHQELLIELPA
jgi:tetratricopeptide (TPR) repeat protein